MVLIYSYYNPNNKSFYFKKCSSYSQFDDRNKNEYGHMIIQKIVLLEDYICDLDQFLEFNKKEKLLVQKQKKLKRYRKYQLKQYIKKLINHIIDLLYRFKSRF